MVVSITVYTKNVPVSLSKMKQIVPQDKSILTLSTRSRKALAEKGPSQILVMVTFTDAGFIYKIACRIIYGQDLKPTS